MPEQTVYDLDHIADFCAARDRDGIVEVAADLFDYFLEVLPPVWMNRSLRLPTGEIRTCSFGFAEGHERITAFFRRPSAGGGYRYFAFLTPEIKAFS